MLTASNDSSYVEMSNGSYLAYFKGNSQNTNAVNFFNNGYNFTMNTATSQLNYYNSTIATLDVVGMQSPMNPQSAAMSVLGNTVSYAGAWKNTNLTYTCGVSQLKETLAINAVSSPSSAADYLQYQEFCYYNSSLTIYHDGVGLLNPSGVQFTTNGSICFNGPGNVTEFWLPTPMIYDSSINTGLNGDVYSNSTAGNYGVLANNGILTIYIRIPVSFLNYAVFPVYLDPPVKVQGYAQGTASVASGLFTVTLSQTPASGNLLILEVMGDGSSANPTVSKVNETNVAWSSVIANNGNTYVTIWKGIVSASAGTIINVTMTGGSGGTYAEVADVCEWSGLNQIVDQTAYKGTWSGGTSSTGTTSSTQQNNELWVGMISAQAGSVANATQSSPTNGFTLLDGGGVALNYDVSLGYLYDSVSSTGTASSGTTLGGAAGTGGNGCIATFEESTAYSRSATQSVSLSLSATRGFTGHRSTTQSVAPLNSQVRVFTGVRSATQTVSFLLTSKRLFTGYRSITQTLSFLLSATRVFTGHRTAIQTISPLLTGARVYSAVRSATQSLSLLLTSKRVFTGYRTGTQLLAVMGTALRLFTGTRSATQQISPLTSAARVFIGTRVATQLISPATSASRSKTAVRTATQTITAFLTGARIFLGFRSTQQNISPLSTASRFFNGVRTASQALTLIASVARTCNLVRSTTQLVSPATSSSIVSVMVRAATQVVSVLTSAARAFFGYRSATQSVSILTGASRLFTGSRVATQIINVLTGLIQGLITIMEPTPSPPPSPSPITGGSTGFPMTPIMLDIQPDNLHFSRLDQWATIAFSVYVINRGQTGGDELFNYTVVDSASGKEVASGQFTTFIGADTGKTVALPLLTLKDGHYFVGVVGVFPAVANGEGDLYVATVLPSTVVLFVLLLVAAALLFLFSRRKHRR